MWEVLEFGIGLFVLFFCDVLGLIYLTFFSLLGKVLGVGFWLDEDRLLCVIHVQYNLPDRTSSDEKLVKSFRGSPVKHGSAEPRFIIQTLA
jgi:hypothetical protein